MKEAKKVETSNLRIENNIISMGDILLQISNISQVSIEPIPKREFKLSAVFVLILGILGAMQRNEDIKAMGVMTIFVVTGYIIWIVIENTKEGNYLYIYMNSGNFYYIFCAEEVFLREVIEVLEYCINNHYVQEVCIDFENCILDNSPIIVGNENEVNR